MSAAAPDKWDTVHGLLPQVKADLRQIEATFGHVEEVELFYQPEEETMAWQQEQDEVVVTEPILPQKDVKLEVIAAEAETWTVKAVAEGGAPGHEGEPYQAMKLTLQIAEPEAVKTEHENARPRLVLEHHLNLARYPYFDRKSTTVKFLGRQHLYDLEEALGFDPIFVNGEGQALEPYVTRTGRKVAPKGDGVKRQPNPSFLSAYFTAEGSPNLEWTGKTVYANVEIERDERYGDKNRIVRFKRAPVAI